MPYLIDGHNLIWAICSDDERFEPVDELTMCWTLSRFLSDIGQEGELIFDGAGPMDKSGFYQVPILNITFAGLGRDTDTVMEYKIEACRSPKTLVVVSTDRRLRAAATRAKAVSIRSDAFWEKVINRLNRPVPRPEPTSKRHGLSESETDQWMSEFGFNE